MKTISNLYSIPFSKPYSPGVSTCGGWTLRGLAFHAHDVRAAQDRGIVDENLMYVDELKEVLSNEHLVRYLYGQHQH